jgi:hypothetical protein
MVSRDEACRVNYERGLIAGQAGMAALRERLKALEVALSFYADEANHEDIGTQRDFGLGEFVDTFGTRIEFDRGKIARDALAPS